MNIDYCEVCGVLIQSGQGPVMLPEGVICAACFETRRVVETQHTTGELIDGLVQFDCCYCHSLLRLKAVTKRTRVRCPKCNDAFYLHADGRIEARLEGSKTAVLQQEDVAPLGRPERAGDKTQPIKRSEVIKGGQHAMLEELKPKGLDFVDALPKREGKIALDTSKYRRPQPAGAESAGLRASEEGDVDLGAQELRRKTQGMQPLRSLPEQPQAEPRAEPQAAPRAEEPVAAATRDAPAAAPEPSEPTRDAPATPAPAAAPAPAGKLLWMAFLLPLVLGVGLAVAAHRELPFTVQGSLGQGLHDMGHVVRGGVRSLDGLLPPSARMALPADVAPIDSR